ncbi:MAG: hypothetical protein HY763_11795 [Planctomycetes bacterium]|nr:hypothetical protein [Planctomycetota bacterium]
MEGFDYLLLSSRWLHIAAAILAIGGAAFMRLVLIPAAKVSLSEGEHERLRETLRRRWAPLVHACIVILLLTGSLNFVLLALPPKIKPLPYHPIFGVKFLAALAVFFIASILAGKAPGFAAMRQQRAKWLTIILLLAGLIVLLSGVLGQVRTSGMAKPATPAVQPTSA